MTKPEPIRVGVDGIAPKPIELTPKRIDWAHLFGLPPFQMYAVERIGKPHDEIMAWMSEWANKQDPQALFDEYCQWHADKGYWPNETPLGELVEPSP